MSKNITKVAILISSYFLSNCTYISYLGNPPKTIFRSRVNLLNTDTTYHSINFMAHKANPIVKDSAGWYNMVITDAYYKNNPKECVALNKQMGTSFINGNSIDISLIWSFENGGNQILKTHFQGFIGFDCGLMVMPESHSLMMRQHQKQVSSVKMVVNHIDSLLLKSFKEPEIWIYIGGGK